MSPPVATVEALDPHTATRAAEVLAGDGVPPGLVDFHSHLVPGVDDGARDLGEAVRAVETLAAEGVRHVLTTPHLDASVIARPELFDRQQLEVEEAWFSVVDACVDRDPPMSFHLGREILLDTASPQLSDPRVRLNGGPYVLVEFPRLNLPAGSEDVIGHISGLGYRPVIAHVERYLYQGDPVPLWDEWRHSGAALQVNAASYVGRYGAAARELAWRALEMGWVDLAASDYHARGRPWITQAREEITAAGGAAQERLLFDGNPRSLLRGEPLEPVAALDRNQGPWSRMRRFFRGR
ncbi:MAG TPA: CpsB/CapC family capsule biosynthesis tyrosine phosphatase [Gemmatimonadota bacterium]|nr:CpsB/CapC family capsule biosynthesis tyrosine phosphatase [Gemmatimonadota bacterium]